LNAMTQPKSNPSQAGGGAPSDSGAPAKPQAPRQTKERLLADLEQAQAERDRFMNIAQRAQADLVNYRRRSEQELDKCRRRALQRIGLQCIEIVDQFEAAISSAKQADDGDDAWRRGVRAVYDNLLAMLKSEGFERFDAVGERFDPTRHEALAAISAPDGEPGSVATQLRSGWSYRDEVIRPALVQTVADGGASDLKDEQNQQKKEEEE